MSDWRRITFHAGEDLLEGLAVVLHEQGCLGTQARDGLLLAWFSPGTDPDAVLRAIRSEPELGAVRLASSELEPDAGWHERWMATLAPIEAGSRLLVVPGPLPAGLPRGKVIIRLTPGRAFGTGEHVTTRLCLAMIESAARPGASVLDVGTGSGILAIGACLLGCLPVVALDTDETAIVVAARNATLNACRDRIRFVAGPLESVTRGAHDIVVANLTAATLTRIMPELAARTGRTAIFSGILRGEEPDVLRAAAEAGLAGGKVAGEGDWCAVQLERPA